MVDQDGETGRTGAPVPGEIRARRALARELHDGVLQVLAASGLKLETALRLLEDRPESARRQLEEVREALEEEQRLIRFFVESYLEPGTAAEAPALGEALRRTAARVRAVWRVDVRLALEVRREPEPSVRHSICRLVQEAAVNARRHGGASVVEVRVTAGADGVAIRVSDNGSGFPFEGRWEHDALVAERKGPLSLRRRVEALGGTLAVTSGPGGATVEVELPV
jgi:signal transduction histidine kinase